MPSADWSPFFFRAQEIQPAKSVSRAPDHSGRWYPPKKKGDNGLDTQSANYRQIWACNGQVIQAIPDAALPPGAQRFRTVSVYHFDDDFSVVEYDVTKHAVGDAGRGSAREGWHRMRFSHQPNGASYASHFGDQNRLRRQHVSQSWAKSLLPKGCWAQPVESWTNGTIGGMNGYLPLLIALIIFSYPSGSERQVLESRFQSGRWIMNPQEQACRDYRGIVVETWSWPGRTDNAILQAFENGEYGNIFI